MNYQYPNPFKPIFNAYQKLGSRFRNFAIFSLIYGLIGAFDTILLNLGVPIGINVTELGQVLTIDPLSIVVFVALIFVFILQILLIINAKKASSQYNRPALGQYATSIILSLVLSIASRIINSSWLFPTILNGTTGTFSILSYTLSGSIIKIGSVALQLMAWLSIAKFFKGAEAVDIQARSTNWTRLVIIALFIYLGEAIAINIPLAIMESVVNAAANGTTTYFIPDIATTIEIIGAVCMIAVYILASIGYFKVGEIFVSLGTIAPPELTPSSTGMAFPGTTSFSPVPPEVSPPGSIRESFETCPFCGARFPVDPNMQFCPSCGAQFRLRK